MHKYQQNNLQNKATKQRHPQNIDWLSTERLQPVKFITVTHLVWLTDLRAKLHSRNNCEIKRTTI